MTPLASIEKANGGSLGSGALQHDRIVVDDLDGRLSFSTFTDTGRVHGPLR